MKADPETSGASRPRNLLVLDLDETLIHASEHKLSRDPDFQLAQYHVYRRPGLEAFLNRCAELFDLAIWSSASDAYVAEIVKQIMPAEVRVEFVWGRSRCTLPRVLRSDEDYLDFAMGEQAYIKPLRKVSKLGWPLERILIVDDTPGKSARNFGNAIYATEFLGDEADDELSRLAVYLERFADSANVRRIEKRFWRDEID